MGDDAPRLSRATLALRGLGIDRDARTRTAHGDVAGPAIDPARTRIGVVHLGLGAFHRAHQAVATEDAAALADEDGWGILGVSQRSRRVAEQLAPQECLYGVLTTDQTASSLRVVGSVRAAVFLGDQTETVLATIAAPTTTVVTATVSEKGYRRSATGGADLSDPDLSADVAALRAELDGSARTPSTDADAVPARTPLGTLTRGLARRWHDDAGPITFVCCDNMPRNGRVVAGLVHDVVAAAGGPQAERLRAWIEDAVGFPSTMVDRITPATTPAHRREAAAMLGLRDDGLVVAEPFSQWVLENSFAAARPRWELSGATFTDDVAPWEGAKLRLLNATHSALAYLGALRGHRTIADAAADPGIAAHARALLEEARQTLAPPAGLDLAAYGEDVLTRFANPATGHTTLQVAADGSQKLPIRVLGTIADRLASGASVPYAATGVLAAWTVFVARGRDTHDAPLGLEDPIADRLRATAAGPESGLADRMLTLEDVFPDEVRDHVGFRIAFRTETSALLRSLPR